MKVINMVAVATLTAVISVPVVAGSDSPGMSENQQASPAVMPGPQGVMAPEMMQGQQGVMAPEMMQGQQGMMAPETMQGQQGMMTPEMMQQRHQMMQQHMMQRRQMMQGQPGMMQGQPGMMQGQPGMMQRRQGMQGCGHQGGKMNPEMMAKKQEHKKVMETHLANIEALLRQLVEQQKAK